MNGFALPRTPTCSLPVPSMPRWPCTEGVLSDPAPFTRMSAVDDDTYIFTVRVWCKTSCYWDVYFNLVEGCSKALQENGIDDPEERIAVRLVKDDD